MSLIVILAFSACQTLSYIKQKTETIQLVLKGEDNNVYMLEKYYDYQFAGKDADRLIRLSNFPKDLNFSKEQLKNSRIIISVRQNGEVSFTAGAEIIVKKKSGNNSKYENEQKNFYNNLKNELDIRKIRYEIVENDEYWIVRLTNAPVFDGKAVKLQNRDEFLQKGKGQLLNIPAELYITDPPSSTKEGIIGGLMGVVVVPVMAVLAIPVAIITPLIILNSDIGNNH